MSDIYPRGFLKVFPLFTQLTSSFKRKNTLYTFMLDILDFFKLLFKRYHL